MSTIAARSRTTEREFRYVIVDVFTDTAFGGNQLAVFPDARGLSDRQMQTVAREFNFAETTFVIPASDPQKNDRIRIFTPKREMPFAGHPTVGTAAALSYLGAARAAGADGTLIYEEGIGPVALRTSPAIGNRVFAELSLQATLELPAGEPIPTDIAHALSLNEREIIASWYAAIGIPFCYVHLASEAAVDAAILDRPVWKAKLSETPAPQLFIFAGALKSGGELYARMFAPALGIEEDPATGSACVGLIGTLAHRQKPRAPVIGLTVRQGVAMGRPSAMTLFADLHEGEVQQLRLGGNSVIVAEGRMTVD
jgi:trans-2,3-dihydro-3-hydroxyanthranilate isomerase